MEESSALAALPSASRIQVSRSSVAANVCETEHDAVLLPVAVKNLQDRRVGLIGVEEFRVERRAFLVGAFQRNPVSIRIKDVVNLDGPGSTQGGRPRKGLPWGDW